MEEMFDAWMQLVAQCSEAAQLSSSHQQWLKDRVQQCPVCGRVVTLPPHRYLEPRAMRPELYCGCQGGQEAAYMLRCEQ